MEHKQPEPIPGQTEVPVSRRTKTPPDVTMLRWALSTLESTADAIYDSYDDVRDQLVYLALLQGERDRLGKIAAAIEARCAGAMHKARINDPSRGLQAERSNRYIYTWDERRLLFDLLYQREMETVSGDWEHLGPEDRAQAEADAARHVWGYVDYIQKFGKWDPRVTPLKDELDWNTEDISQYRKSEKGARKVKVTLTELEDDDAATDPGDEPLGGPPDVDITDHTGDAADDGPAREAVL